MQWRMILFQNTDTIQVKIEGATVEVAIEAGIKAAATVEAGIIDSLHALIAFTPSA